jgi:RHS repeat-associated protein
LLTDKWNPTLNSTPQAGDPKTHFDYYTSGPWTDHVQTETDPLGHRTQYEYDKTYDANGESTGAACAGHGLVTKISYPDDTHSGAYPSGTYKAFAYDKYGNKNWEENELRQRTTYTYDNYNRVQTVTLPSPGGTTTYDYSPTKGDTTACYKHTTASAYFVTDPVNIVTANIYDGNWRKTSTTAGYGNASPFATTAWFGYDPVGNPTEMTDPRGSGLGDANYTTTTTYDPRNRKYQITDPQGHLTAFGYDPASNVTSITRPDGTVENKTYDFMNRVQTDTVPKEGTASNVTQSITTTFVYNPSGSIYSVQDGKGQTTTFNYDPSDLKTRLIYPDNTDVNNPTDYEGWTYDNAKNLMARRTVNGTSQNFTYDSRNRKTAMTWSNGIDSANFAYDAAGRLITAQNPISTITRQYDPAGRLTLDRQSVGTLGNKDVQYAYDAAGKDTRLYLTSASYDYTFSYDPMGRFEKIFATGSSSPSFQYYYDLASNETQRFNYSNSVAQSYTRDNLNRMSRRDVTLSANTISSEIYGYDAMSRLTSVLREDSTTDQFTYYLNGELLTAQYGVPQSSPTPTPAPGGQVATPTFNPTGYNVYPGSTATVTISTATSGAQIRYTKNGTTPSSTVGTLIAGSSAKVTFSVSAGVYLQAVAFKSGMSDSAVTTDYYYRDGGTQADPTASVPPVPPPPDIVVLDPTLPDVSASAATAGSTGTSSSSPRNVTYTLDKAGNRTQVADTGVTTNYTPNVLNQYINAVGSDSISNGTEHEVSAYKGVNYTYINDERLASVASGSNSYQLVYDALGRCVKRTLNGATTYYIYDGEKPILEYSSAGAITAKNLYGKAIDEILIRTDLTVTPNRVLYYQQDHEGSVTHLTDANGALMEKYQYDAFGAPTIKNAAGTVIASTAYGNRFLFTGREYATTFGIYEYRARAYHPGLGRFTSEDPMGFAAGDYNLFRYCHNDPEDRTDPMGLDDPSRTGSNTWGPGVLPSQTVADKIKAWEYQMNEKNKAPDAAGVEWSATVTQSHDPNYKFKEGQAAITDWKVGSTPKMDNGKVVGFKNELRIIIHWNDSFPKWDRYRSAILDKTTGEIAHTIDALNFARAGNEGKFSSAWKIANDTARELKGGMSADYAKAKMESSLNGWTRDSIHESHRQWDEKVYAPSQDAYGHLYGLYGGD